MKKQYAEVTIRKQARKWKLVEYSESFLGMTGFEKEEIQLRFSGNFLEMFYAFDIKETENIFDSRQEPMAMYPGTFKLICANKEGLLPVILQFLREEKDSITILIHEASFLGKSDDRNLNIAMEQSSSYIIEYEVKERLLLESSGLQKYFGLSGNVSNLPEALIDSGVVVPESVEMLRGIFSGIEINDRSEGVICLYSTENKKNEIWLRLSFTSVLDEANHPIKAVLFMKDITEQHNIEIRYLEEENRRVAMTYDMNFSCQFDLTEDKIISMNETKFPFFDLNKLKCASEFVRKNAGKYVHPDDRFGYLKALNISEMVERFQKGIPEVDVEFRAKISDKSYDPEGEYHWRKGFVHIIREPVSGHICAYIYTKNIDEEKKRELDLMEHAQRDSLTGLYNRYTTELKCDELLKEGKKHDKHVMYMLDLDNFKSLNDTYGHCHGDQMLRKTAESLQSIFDEKVLIGRLGGDEFIVFQVAYASMEEVEKKAEDICHRIKALDEAKGIVTVSVGISVAPKDGEIFTDLYRYADDALYQAKRIGKNGYAIYSQMFSKDNGIKERLPVSREWLLEESNDIIYVCDFYSYDLLYMNIGARRLFNVENGSYVGQKCYELLQNKTQPCDFCTNHLLCREQFYCWEFYNEILNKTLWIRDRIVDWYGVPARIEFATDVSEMDIHNRELKEQVAIDKIIISCLHILSDGKTLDETAVPMLQKLAEFYGADKVCILRYDEKDKMLQPYYEWCKSKIKKVNSLLNEDKIVPPAMLEDCILNRKNYIYDTVDISQRYVPFYMNGKPAGIIGVDNPTIYREEMTVLETLSFFIAEELSRNILAEELGFFGYHDLLTGLCNRNQYMEYLKGMDDNKLQSLGIVVADLNALKEVNKYRGHEHGDKIVRRAAELLKENFSDAWIFRLCGDEFAIHCENIKRQEFIKKVKKMNEKAGDIHGCAMAIGYAWTNEDIDCAKLTAQANDVMILQKQEYYKHVDSSGRKHSKTSGQRELLALIKNGNFKMFLQPKADCNTYQVNGAEALVRYMAEDGKIVMPDNFIPTLEREYLIQYIDLFIFEEVCKLLARWKNEGRELMIISLNFSRQTALEPTLMDNLSKIVNKYQVPNDYIEIEITETLGDYENATIAEICKLIKEQGFRMALDDFGSRYTNMSMLSIVPVDVLKLDRGIVKDVLKNRSNRLVLKVVLSLCSELGISAIAEGVETREQLEMLRTLHCDDFQGYLLSKPIPVDEFEKLFCNNKK